jgi:hypothetical protein
LNQTRWDLNSDYSDRLLERRFGAQDGRIDLHVFGSIEKVQGNWRRFVTQLPLRRTVVHLLEAHVLRTSSSGKRFISSSALSSAGGSPM